MARPGNKKVTVVLGLGRVGSKVGVVLGGHTFPALVVEERGNLGPGGTPVVRVEFIPTTPEVDQSPEHFEVPVAALVRLPAKKTVASMPSP